MKYTLKELYRAGLVSHTANFYIDLAEKKESLIAIGMNGKQAEAKLSQDMQISTRTIQRASKAKKQLDKQSDTI